MANLKDVYFLTYTEREDSRMLATVMGSMVEVGGETYMLVALRGHWAVLENEGERTIQVHVSTLRKIMTKGEER